MFGLEKYRMWIILNPGKYGERTTVQLCIFTIKREREKFDGLKKKFSKMIGCSRFQYTKQLVFIFEKILSQNMCTKYYVHARNFYN